MPTRREQIIDRALGIIELKPNGIELSELCQMVRESFPDFGQHFIRDNIILLDRFKPDKVYKPERGWFRHINYKKTAGVKDQVPQVTNLFAGIPEALPEELFQVLLQAPHCRLERIVSHGQASPPGFWYDEPTHEWVALLSGRAALKFADRPDLEVLNPGDHLLIPAGCRHRVEWTDPEDKTVWLALHYR